MNNKDLIKQYIDSGIQIPEYQYKKLNPNELKTYGRKRIIAHNMHADEKNSEYMLSFDELEYLKPNFKDLPEINKKPFNLKGNSFWHYTHIFPELLDNIPDEYLSNIRTLSTYTIYNALLRNPKLIEIVKEKLNHFHSFQIINLIIKYPELYTYCINQLKSMSKTKFDKIIEDQPKLFEPMLKDGLIDSHCLTNIYVKNPDLYQYVQEIISKLDFYEMEEILEKQPKLLDFFLHINGNKLSDDDINYFKERYSHEQ